MPISLSLVLLLGLGGRVSAQTDPAGEPEETNTFVHTEAPLSQAHDNNSGTANGKPTSAGVAGASVATYVGSSIQNALPRGPITAAAPGTTVFAPPSSTELASIRSDVDVLVRSGNRGDASAVLDAALELHPGDATLLAMQKLMGQEELQGAAQIKVADAERKVLDVLNVHRKSENVFKLDAYGETAPIRSSGEAELAAAVQFPNAASQAPFRSNGVLSRQLRDAAASQAAHSWVNALHAKISVGDGAAALAMLDDELAHVPDDLDFMALRASLYLGMQRYADAERQARAVLARRESAGVRTTLAAAFNGQHRAAAALVQANRALTLDPQDAEAWFARSGAHLRLGEPEAGLADLKKAAELDPVFRELYQQTVLASVQQSRDWKEDPILVFFGVLIAGLSVFLGIQIARRLRERWSPLPIDEESE